MKTITASTAPATRISRPSLLRDIRKNRLYFFLLLPGLLYFIIFKYGPMGGIVVAFQDFSPFLGIEGIIEGEWVGLKHFQNFVQRYYFWNVMRNTVVISFLRLIFGFPAPIILALLLNEVRHVRFKKTVQTISYLPHFISWVVAAGLVAQMLSPQSGLLNAVRVSFGLEPVLYLAKEEYFRRILVTSAIWKGVGWGTIVILASLSGVNPELYESAELDGAGRLAQTWYITLPSIAAVVSILFIFRIGDIMDAGFEQILLLYSPVVYSVGDIIDTYVYREGLQQANYSFAAAVGVFKSIIALILIVVTNTLAKRLGHEGIW